MIIHSLQSSNKLYDEDGDNLNDDDDDNNNNKKQKKLSS